MIKGKVSLKKRIIDAFSGNNIFLSLVTISPAVENSLLTSTEVAGGVRKYSAKLETILSIGLTDVDMFFWLNRWICICFNELIELKIHESFFFTLYSWIIWDIKSAQHLSFDGQYILVLRLYLAAKPSSYFATWFQKMPKNKISQTKKFSWLFWILCALNSDRFSQNRNDVM